MPEKENRPAGNGADSTTTECDHYIQALRRRRASTYRLPPLQCGHVDPWRCDCGDHNEATEKYADGYRDAAVHLLTSGLTPAPSVPAMRILWRRGGADRELVSTIAQRWEVTA